MIHVGPEFWALPGGGASAFIGDVDGHCAGPFWAAACTSSAAGAWSTFRGVASAPPLPLPALADKLASALAEGNPPPELPLGGPEAGAEEKSAKSPKSSPRRLVWGCGLGLEEPGGGASVGIANEEESSMECFI